MLNTRPLYDGEILHRDPTPASRDLVARTLRLLQDTLGPEIREAQAHLPDEVFFEHMGRCRRVLFEADEYRDAVRRVLTEGGLDASQVAFDPLKLRIISHQGHENPRAVLVYYPHRDTWYGHPQSLLVWWIPLHDLDASETFEFYPDRFRQAVPNDSECFDYDEWIQDARNLRIGWQHREAGRTVRYPGVTSDTDRGAALGFSCRQADNLVFSGAHFHCTRPHCSGRTRFSLDFRFVHLDDHARGLGAPNVDNRSRGSALASYVHP